MAEAAKRPGLAEMIALIEKLDAILTKYPEPLIASGSSSTIFVEPV
jgi:hypothetical protein